MKLKILIIFPLLIGSIVWSAVPTSNAPFLKPDEAIAKMKIADGFEVKAFVGEPDIGEEIIIIRPAGHTPLINAIASIFMRIQIGMGYSIRRRLLLKTLPSVLELSSAWAASMWECPPS